MYRNCFCLFLELPRELSYKDVDIIATYNEENQIFKVDISSKRVSYVIITFVLKVSYKFNSVVKDTTHRTVGLAQLKMKETFRKLDLCVCVCVCLVCLFV